MRIFGWSKAFEERKTYEDIPSKVQKTEMVYWVCLVFSIVWALAGVAIMLSAPTGHLKQLFLGLFIAVDGAIAWAIIKIVVHIRLAMYWIIWDSQNRESKSEAHTG